jgi:hypothetical protein
LASFSNTRTPYARRICSKTGLSLVPSAGRTVYRLAKPYYGPLNPLLRGVFDGDSRLTWNRYDVAGQRTVYAADTPEGAYGELLAPLKPMVPVRAAAYFDDVTAGDDLESLIRDEWRAAGHRRGPRQVDLGWLGKYRLYRLRLPTMGWFIDIEASSSLSAITDYAADDLRDHGLAEVSVAELRGNDRRLTTAIATRLWPLTLDDGGLAHGVMYGSRHGSEWNCWAIWLRRTKHGRATADLGTPVARPADNPPLRTILAAYGLTGGW